MISKTWILLSSRLQNTSHARIEPGEFQIRGTNDGIEGTLRERLNHRVELYGLIGVTIVGMLITL